MIFHSYVSLPEGSLVGQFTIDVGKIQCFLVLQSELKFGEIQPDPPKSVAITNAFGQNIPKLLSQWKHIWSASGVVYPEIQTNTYAGMGVFPEFNHWNWMSHCYCHICNGQNMIYIYIHGLCSSIPQLEFPNMYIKSIFWP